MPSYQVGYLGLVYLILSAIWANAPLNLMFTFAKIKVNNIWHVGGLHEAVQRDWTNSIYSGANRWKIPHFAELQTWQHPRKSFKTPNKPLRLALLIFTIKNEWEADALVVFSAPTITTKVIPGLTCVSVPSCRHQNLLSASLAVAVWACRSFCATDGSNFEPRISSQVSPGVLFFSSLQTNSIIRLCQGPAPGSGRSPSG